MRWMAVFALSALPAQSADFTSAPSWSMACRMTPEVRADSWCTDQAECPAMDLQVSWDRTKAEAKILWEIGLGKGMSEIAGFPGASGQDAAHFTLSPANTTYGATDEYWVEIDTGMFSVRFSGDAALTYHSVRYGGMKPLSATGKCTITPLDAKEE